MRDETPLTRDFPHDESEMMAFMGTLTYLSSEEIFAKAKPSKVVGTPTHIAAILLMIIDAHFASSSPISSLIIQEGYRELDDIIMRERPLLDDVATRNLKIVNALRPPAAPAASAASAAPAASAASAAVAVAGGRHIYHKKRKTQKKLNVRRK